MERQIVKKLLPLLLLTLAVAHPTMAQEQAAQAATVAVEVGKLLVDVEGKRIGAVYRVGEDGSAQVIIDGKIYVVPATTLSVDDDKLVTSLKKKDVLSKR
jgi:hypothetical protein